MNGNGMTTVKVKIDSKSESYNEAGGVAALNGYNLPNNYTSGETSVSQDYMVEWTASGITSSLGWKFSGSVEVNDQTKSFSIIIDENSFDRQTAVSSAFEALRGSEKLAALLYCETYGCATLY